MKKVKLFSFALAALMLGACSSEDVIDNGDQGTVLPGEKGYISLGINLPTTPSTRATTNDNFADGTADEYAVDDATLIVLEGTSESTATVTGVYKLTLPGGTNVGTATDNITTSYQLTQAINKPTGNNNLYALVVLNKDNVELDGFNGKKLSELNTAFDTNYDFLNEDGHILMTNAPLYTKPGEKAAPADGNLVTLTEINPKNVFTTEAEAKANPAANVYVERALAKVTVTANADGYTPESNAKFTGAKVEGYALDVVNKNSYLVRNIPEGAAWWNYASSSVTSNGYRFVGSASVGDNLYRTYWGVDPNYDNYDASEDFVLAEKTPSLTPIETASYCKENTFNVANQKQDGTTRVIVAAKITVEGFGDGETFYTLDNNKDVIYSSTNIQKEIKSYFLNNKDVKAALASSLDETASESSIDVDLAFDKGAGNVTVTDVTFKDPTIFKNDEVPAELKKDGAAYESAIAEINSHVYSCYAGGIAYYPVMIKHFGDDLTPWSAEGKTESYPGNAAEANWLGRYGVLRNNWYDISVTSIKSIGYAEVPDVNPTFDDPVESWISVKINVLSWAKRTQNVDL